VNCKGVVEMDRKYADRPDWSRVLKKSFKLDYICEKEFSGYVSAIYIDKVKAPLIKNIFGKEYCIVDDGYTWLQYLPTNGNYSITTMFNKNKEIVQWYFDIIKHQGVDDRSIPFFDDLYLDVVVLPSSEILLLDEDELKDALDKNEITKGDYDLAYKEAKMLMEGIALDIDNLNILSNRYLDYLDNRDIRFK
jgi:predicted RNA-binding protein associated with RNAse of E/G family